MTTTPPRKPRVDWDAARAFYVALGPEHRTYARVAAEYHVSEHTVGKWAKRQDWPAVAAKADNAAAEKALAKSVRSLELRQLDTIRVADKARATVLADDVVLDPNVALRVLPRLATIEQLIGGEATGRIEVSEVTAVLSTVFVIAGRYVPADRRAEFMRELDEALGGLLELGGEGGLAA